MIIFDRLWATMAKKGISTYTLREKHEFDSRTIARFRSNDNVTTATINKLCNILECDVTDILEFVPDEKT